MRYTILFLLCCFSAQAQDDWLLLLPKWEVGDQRTLTISYEERITRKDTVLRERQDSITDYIEVLTASSQGYTLDWMAERFKVDVFTDVPELQYAVDQVLAQTDSLQLEIKVHPAGYTTGLRNWDRVQNVYDAIFDYVGTTFKKAGIEMSDEEVDQLVLEMKRRLDERQQVENTALQPYQTLFNAYNVAIHRDSVKRQEREVPIDFANRPVPGVLETRITELGDSTATIQTQTTVDPEKARVAINEYLKLRQAMGEEAMEPLGNGSFSFEEKSLYSFERWSGWWTEVVFSATTEINETRIEQIVRYQFAK